MRDHGSGADQGTRADRHTSQNHSATADRGTATDPGENHFPVGVGLESAGGRRPGVEVIDEHDAVAYENLVLDGDPLADKCVTLDLAPSADRHILLNLDEGADAGVVADRAPVKIHEVANDESMAKSE